MRVALVGVVLFACSSSATAPKPPPGPGTGGPTQVRPLAFGADAKRGDSALILGTDGAGGSTVVPLAAGERKVSVDSLYVITGAGTATGGLGAVELTAATSSAGQVRIGIFEDVSGGLGPSWRAGVWTASLVAADVLGKDLTDLTFTAAASGRVDGASASGLMTAGYLAALLGRTVATDVTMTGIINPDGTIGPVGGIPQKFEAAIAKGKKRLGYPIGMRLAKDAITGEDVDLVELAKSRGAVAVEIADVYAALELLTGEALPRPVPVPVEQMALPATVVTALDAQYDVWKGLLKDGWAQNLELSTSSAVPPMVSEFARGALDDLAAAEQLRAAGQGAVALRLVTRAWFQAATATSTADVLALVAAGDLAGAQAKLDEFEQFAATTDSALLAMGGFKADTMGGHLQLVSAFRLAITGWGFRAMASTELLPKARVALAALAGKPPKVLASRETASELGNTVFPAIGSIARAVVALARASTTLEVEAAASLDYRCSLPNVRRLATSFKAAATSNLAYLDALFVAELATGLKISLDEARELFAMREPGYLVAMMGANVTDMSGLPAQLKEAWGENSIAWALFALAASELSFGDTSELISEYYSLQTQFGPDGSLLSVAHPEAFEHVLSFAERRTREQAHAALVATGSIPVQTQLYYQIAETQRAGGLRDRLDALGTYRVAMQFAQTAVMLARN